MSETTTKESRGMRALRGGEAERLGTLQKIGAARGSTVISYLTSFRDGWGSMVLSEDVRIIERHVVAAKADGAKKLDLFISTWGGDATLPWSLHAMLRDYFPKAKIGVILPFEAYSAGTGVSLGGDEIIMGPSSVLGPTDTQVYGRFFQTQPVGGGVSALQGFFQMLKDFDARGKVDDAEALDWLTRNTDPLLLGEIYRKFRENRRKILKILSARAKPLSQKDNEKIADFFLYEVGIHGQGIRRREAKAEGLSFITDVEETGLEKDVVALFGHYAEIMQLFTPFARRSPGGFAPGFGGDVDLEGEHAGATPVVLVESIHSTDAAFKAYGTERSWGIPDAPAPEPAEAAPRHGHMQAPSAGRVLWTSTEMRRGTMRRR